MTREPDVRFLHLVEDYGDILLRAARLLCGDWAQAEDLLQRALARTLIRWDPRHSDSEAAAGAQLELVATYLDELPELDSEPPRVGRRGPLLAGLTELESAVRATVIGRYYLRVSDRDLAELLGVEPGRVRHIGVRSLDWLDRRAHLAGTEPAAPAAARVATAPAGTLAGTGAR